MYKTLRTESLKKVLPRIICCALAAIILLGISGGGLIKLITGPKAINDIDTGDYVSLDASDVIVAFATLSVTNDDETVVKKTYYLFPYGDSYIAVMDRKEKNSDILDRAMEQSKEYYLGDLETLTKLGALSGTVKALDEDMTSYMTDCIDNYELPGYEEGADTSRLIIPYQIELDQVGLLSKTWTLVLFGGAVVFLILLAAQLVVLFAGCYQKKVRALIGEEPEDFADAAKIERVRVGSYIWYSKGPGSRAVKTADIIWGYALPEPLVVSKYRWPVALYDHEQQLTRICFAEQKSCQDFLKAIAAQGNPFVNGYTSDYSEKFQNDFAGFCQDAQKS
jgi:hypothetical protein